MNRAQVPGVNEGATMPPLSVAALCRKYPHDSWHAGHVTQLAMDLFDGLRPSLRLPARDRVLLRAAARLHDIGFCLDPDHHARASAGLVDEEGLSPLTSDERFAVSAAIAGHTGSRATAGRAPTGTPSQRRRIARIGSLLRVADGLDCGHVQDARIAAISRSGTHLVIHVASPVYAANLARARQKTALWARTFSLRPRFVLDGEPDEQAPLLEGVVKAETPVIEAAYRILGLQYRIMRDSRKRVLTNDDPEHLHDFRVAARRLRAGIKLCRPLLTGTSAQACSRRLRGLRSSLGGTRDAHVWLLFLESLAQRKACSRSEAFTAYMLRYRERDETHDDTLRAILTGCEYAQVMDLLARLIRLELTEKSGHGPGATFGPYATAHLRNCCRRLFKRAAHVHTDDADAMHRFRKRCRQGRYVAEFTAATLGEQVTELAHGFKAVTTSLGTVHDMDLHLATPEKSEMPAIVRRAAQARRKDAVRAFRKAWHTLQRIAKRCAVW